MLNESELIINLQKFNIKNLMNFCTCFFNTNYFFVLIFTLYITDIINNHDLYIFFLSSIIGLTLKLFFKRPRPYVVHKDIKNLSNSNYVSSVFSIYSLPSGHTIEATILALILINKYNIDLFLFLPAIIGLSRIYLGVHYISDVLLSIIISIIVYYYF